MKEVFHEDFSAGCMVRGGDRTAASVASLIALPQPDESFGDADVNTLFKVSDLAPVPLPAATWLLLGGLGVLRVAARGKHAA